MINLSEEVLTLLDEGRASIRGLMRFDLGTGTYGFWNGSEPITYSGLSYLPGGIIEVDDVNAVLGFEASGLSIKLAESAEDGITPEVLATIESEDYHQRPVRVMDAYFHPDTGAMLMVTPVYRGLIDTVQHTSQDDEAGIVAQCESRAIDNSKTGYRDRSSADQKAIWAGDRFYEHAEVAGKQEIFFGRSKD